MAKGIYEIGGSIMNDRDIFRDTEGVLYNYSMLKAEIHNLELEIEELQDEYQGVCSIGYEERTGPTNKISDSVANEVIHKEKVILKLQRIKRSKERLLRKINAAIDSLDETEKKFVEYRYTSNKKRSWNQVGALMNLDPNHCCNVIRPSVINKLSCLIYMTQKHE